MLTSQLTPHIHSIATFNSHPKTQINNYFNVGFCTCKVTLGENNPTFHFVIKITGYIVLNIVHYLLHGTAVYCNREYRHTLACVAFIGLLLMYSCPLTLFIQVI